MFIQRLGMMIGWRSFWGQPKNKTLSVTDCNLSRVSGGAFNCFVVGGDFTPYC